MEGHIFAALGISLIIENSTRKKSIFAMNVRRSDIFLQLLWFLWSSTILPTKKASLPSMLEGWHIFAAFDNSLNFFYFACKKIIFAINNGWTDKFLPHLGFLWSSRTPLFAINVRRSDIFLLLLGFLWSSTICPTKKASLPSKLEGVTNFCCNWDFFELLLASVPSIMDGVAHFCCTWYFFDVQDLCPQKRHLCYQYCKEWHVFAIIKDFFDFLQFGPQKRHLCH